MPRGQHKRRPPLSPEAQESQMVAMAMELAADKIRDGTASSQIIVHYLKLGSERSRLEREKLARETELLRAKSESIQSAKHIEEMYSNALKAMREYSGQSTQEDYEDDNDDERY